MPTVSDEDVLELVERFDISIEDTATIGKLTAALKEKLADAGVDHVDEKFLDRFMRGLELKFEALPEVGVHFEVYHRPSVAAYPAGFWQPVYRDVGTGRFMTAVDVGKRLYL